MLAKIQICCIVPLMNTSITPAPQGKGLSIAALVLGLVTVATGIFFYISLATGITGIILAAISLKKKNDGRGMAMAGLITSIIGVVFGLATLVFFIIGIASGAGNVDTTATY